MTAFCTSDCTPVPFRLPWRWPSCSMEFEKWNSNECQTLCCWGNIMQLTGLRFGILRTTASQSTAACWCAHDSSIESVQPVKCMHSPLILRIPHQLLSRLLVLSETSSPIEAQSQPQWHASKWHCRMWTLRCQQMSCASKHQTRAWGQPLNGPAKTKFQNNDATSQTGHCFICTQDATETTWSQKVKLCLSFVQLRCLKVLLWACLSQQLDQGSLWSKIKNRWLTLDNNSLPEMHWQTSSAPVPKLDHCSKCLHMLTCHPSLLEFDECCWHMRLLWSLSRLSQFVK